MLLFEVSGTIQVPLRIERKYLGLCLIVNTIASTTRDTSLQPLAQRAQIGAEEAAEAATLRRRGRLVLTARARPTVEPQPQ